MPVDEQSRVRAPLPHVGLRVDEEPEAQAADRAAQRLPPGGRRLRREESDRLRQVGDTIASADSCGTLMILTYTAPAGFAGPPPHAYAHTEEALHVLAGTLTVTAGDEVVRAGAGAIIFVPRGVAHTFANPDPAPVTVQCLWSLAEAVDPAWRLFRGLPQRRDD